MAHAVCSADGLGCALVADINTVGGLLRIEDRSIFNIALWQVPFHSTVGKDHNVPIRFSRTEPFGPVVDQSEEEVRRQTLIALAVRMHPETPADYPSQNMFG